MLFILQKSVYDKIHSDITTKQGKRSTPIQIKHMYIVHHINHSRIFKKDKYANGVPMNSEVLTRLFGKGSEVKNVLKRLEEFNFIVKVRNGKLGVCSARYVLHDSIQNEKVLQVDFNSLDSALIAKLENHNSDIKSFDKQLQMLKNHVSINALGKEYFKIKYGMIRNDISFAVEPLDLGLKAIYDGNFFASRPNIKSRVYTNLTSLSRNHRKYVEINGKPMLMTDISNSQILLTVPLLHNYWAKKSGKGLINLPNDVNDFQKLAETGKFYEKIAKCAGITFNNDNDRNTFKKKVFEEIWFSKNSEHLPAIKKAFKYQFPTAFDIIWKLKEEKYNEFAIKLQQFEASILVDKVWKKMYSLGRTIFTLHDAIICNSVTDLELAEKLIRNEMVKYRIEPMFKREHEEFNPVTA